MAVLHLNDVAFVTMQFVTHTHGQAKKQKAIHDAVSTRENNFILAFKKNVFWFYRLLYIVYVCVHKRVCLHLGVMICEIIYCPSVLEPLRSSSLLSKPVIPHSQHKKHCRATAPRPPMHKTLLPHKNTYTVPIEETEIHDKLCVFIAYLAEKNNVT